MLYTRRTRLPHGAYTQQQINPGYYAYRVKDACQVLVGPGKQFASRRDVEPGEYFGWMSEPNLRCSRLAPQRPAVDGWAPGYCSGQGYTGWVPARALGRAPQRYARRGRWEADGPAHYDFEIPAGSPFPCQNVPRLVRGAPAVFRAVVETQYVYIRWAAMSTAYGYLLAGEGGTVLFSRPGWWFIVVRKPRALPHLREARGFVASPALRRI